MKTVKQTREEWLIQAAAELRKLVFAPVELEVPDFHVSVGWDKGRASKGMITMGQCWSSKVSADGVPAVFVVPIVGEAIEVLKILAHEMIHVVDDCVHGHKGPFARMHKAIGMVGKKTTHECGEALHATLELIASELPEWPHAAMKPYRAATGEKKQGTRNLKVQCPEDGYVVRTTRKWLDEMGAPYCPCGAQMEEA